MMRFTFKDAEDSVLYKAIAGSKAYGLDLPTSDTDIRGIFLIPNDYLLGNGYVEQVADKKNDIVYYELNRFVNLLAKNNPNIIENLFVPKDKVLEFDDRLMPLYRERDSFLTKKIAFTFGGYAISQIKKSRGLNKKIVNPISKERKSPLDFCHVFEKEDGYMMKAKQWLRKHGFKQEHIGLSKMPNGVGLYKMYYDWIGEEENNNPRFEHLNKQPRYRGIIKEGSDEISHSEIPKGSPLVGYLVYDKDGYSMYCKYYKEYWEWVNNRNPHRYNDNIKNKHDYDGKNMMHCVRMLDTAIDIANGDGVRLVRPDRDFLLSIRKGQVPYKDIMSMVEKKKEIMDQAIKDSHLPDEVDTDLVNDIILTIRKS